MQRYTQFTLHFNNRISRSCGSFSLSLLRLFFSDRSLPVAGWKSVPTAPAPIRARGQRLGHIDREVTVVVQQWMCSRAEYGVGGWDGESMLKPGFCCELNRRKSGLIPLALVELRAAYWGVCH